MPATTLGSADHPLLRVVASIPDLISATGASDPTWRPSVPKGSGATTDPSLREGVVALPHSCKTRNRVNHHILRRRGRRKTDGGHRAHRLRRSRRRRLRPGAPDIGAQRTGVFPHLVLHLRTRRRQEGRPERRGIVRSMRRSTRRSSTGRQWRKQSRRIVNCRRATRL